MSASKGFMQATCYFSEKYIQQVYKLSLLEEIKEKIRSTKNVGKSKPCIFQLKDDKNLIEFEKVMQLKIKYK